MRSTGFAKTLDTDVLLPEVCSQKKFSAEEEMCNYFASRGTNGGDISLPSFAGAMISS